MTPAVEKAKAQILASLTEGGATNPTQLIERVRLGLPFTEADIVEAFWRLEQEGVVDFDGQNVWLKEAERDDESEHPDHCLCDKHVDPRTGDRIPRL